MQTQTVDVLADGGSGRTATVAPRLYQGHYTRLHEDCFAIDEGTGMDAGEAACSWRKPPRVDYRASYYSR